MKVVTTSWGRVARAEQFVHEPAYLDEAVQIATGAPNYLAYGLGRSYGDVCLNNNGTQVRMHRLDHILSADWETGIVRAEAGLSLDQLLQLSVPRGWFVPVTPGTKSVTLGGAVANDVHGKNHEGEGTFGCHVRAMGLLRSTGEILEIGPDLNPELFAATVGGLGLTGVIVWVELQMKAVSSSFFETETLRMRNLDSFFEFAAESRGWPYTVAWVDCLAKGGDLGRGLFTRGRHALQGGLECHKASGRITVPWDAPEFVLNSPSVRAFNVLYSKRPGGTGAKTVHYDPFLYPLDGLHAWNRLYGRRGFYQHQSVVPLSEAPDTLKRLLELTSTYRQGSFLVVLKLFGRQTSPGLLSFPMEGATFALDLPNCGEGTRSLLRKMGDVVLEAGGRLYPAKDATMPSEAFRAGFPRWKDVEAHRDPAISSDFWRRVTRDAA
jgi:FAD/FMN-containing dehydrogenase